jgi:hypothetical protein
MYVLETCSVGLGGKFERAPLKCLVGCCAGMGRNVRPRQTGCQEFASRSLDASPVELLSEVGRKLCQFRTRVEFM